MKHWPLILFFGVILAAACGDDDYYFKCDGTTGVYQSGSDVEVVPDSPQCVSP